VADHLRRLAAALDAQPAELVGLLVLLVGGVAATLVIWIGPPGAGPAVLTDAAAPALLLEDPPPSELTVHVAGAVRRPGIVRLTSGARVADAIAAAGGARADALLDGLNLAAVVEDGQQVLVPAATAGGQGGQGAAGGGSVDPVVDADGRVDLNLATAEHLEQLPGIGPVLAARILAWRDQHGPFTETGQLRQVPGIGERTFQSLAELVRV